MGSEVSAANPIPRTAMVAVFSVHVLDTSTTCLCAGVCRAWHTLAMNPSSHSGIVVFEHCLWKQSAIDDCDCDLQLIPKIIAISAFKNIVHLNLCNVHLSISSLHTLGRALRFHGIRPQLFLCFLSRTFSSTKGFMSSNVIDSRTSYFYLLERFNPWRCLYIRMFLNEAGLSEVQMTDPKMLVSLIENCWNSKPSFLDAHSFPLPDRQLLVELLHRYFVTYNGQGTIWNRGWSVGEDSLSVPSNWLCLVSFEPAYYFTGFQDCWKHVSVSFYFRSVKQLV